GAWHAGEAGAGRLMRRGRAQPRMKCYQETGRGVAMDRAEIMSLSDTCKTPAGTFQRCMRVKESSPLDLGVSEYKFHAPGIGLVRDDKLRLVKHGFIDAAAKGK